MSWPMPCSIFRVYSTYTAQLSSKRKGMEAEGKTWNYHDILAQFITMHNKKSNVLLIWSGDWPTYSSNSDKYYVILAGEGFDSTDEAWNWCKANNYGPNDCMVVPEFLRTLVFARPRGDDQFADCTFSPSLDMSR